MSDVELHKRIEDFVLHDVPVDDQQVLPRTESFWLPLRAMGTELWLDTGDIQAASELWNANFTALTTNNTLLNNEVQKGIYDDLVQQAAQLVTELDEETQVIEIAFILNAVHGRRLAQRFGAKVSVELHTRLAHDIDRTLAYARRYAQIDPEQFIVKIPLTPSGLIATRQLRTEGIPINFTLGFSARQNAIAAAFAKPNYVNVFLGRLNSYVSNNGLGDGFYVGEKATLASQRVVHELNPATKQIAASMRSRQNVVDLAGLDVYTMPVSVAAEALTLDDVEWSTRAGTQYEVRYTVLENEIRPYTMYGVRPVELEFAELLDAAPVHTGEELLELAEQASLSDIFPRWSQEDLAIIAADGKIPDHAKWADRIESGELAIDTLLNQAGLAAFEKDQAALDQRIRGLVFGG